MGYPELQINSLLSPGAHCSVCIVAVASLTRVFFLLPQPVEDTDSCGTPEVTSGLTSSTHTGIKSN